MIDEILKKAFFAGLSKLKLEDDCSEPFPRPTNSSVIDCYKAIEAEMGHDTGFNPLHVTLDAFWAFIHKLGAATLNNKKEYMAYSGAMQLTPLMDALMSIALQEAILSLQAVYGDEIKDDGFVLINPLEPEYDVTDRPDITLRSLVDEVISGKMTSYNKGQESIFDDAVPDLIKLKKLFQDQVDYIDSKIKEAKNNPA